MSKLALIMVDLQNDYFPGGKWELEGTLDAAMHARKLLDAFRANKLPVVFIRHEFSSEDAPFFLPNSEGAELHSSIQNLENEPVVVKQQINSFRETNLKDVLNELGVERVLVCGAMSHMCIDAVVRAAADFGFECMVAHDACATLDLEFQGIKVPAKQVHAAIMAALDFGYAKVASTAELLSEVK